MPFDDQYTAFGPADPATKGAFSTLDPIVEYGVNVQGTRCGVYGESVAVSEERSSTTEGVGVQGTGESFGVIGNGNRGLAGVLGEHGHGGIGVFGAVMSGGTGVVGVSLQSIVNPLVTLSEFPGPANGDGTGVFGASGTGVGVLGQSEKNDAVVGRSDAEARSGVFGFNSRSDGRAFGVFGRCDAPDGAGVGGRSNAAGSGVHGHSTGGDGIVGLSDAAGGNGVSGFSPKSVGVRGTSPGGTGVFGHSETRGKGGVFGENTGSPGAIGGQGLSQEVFGVIGQANDKAGIGVSGESAAGTGLSGTGGNYGARLQGGTAPLRLLPSASVGRPTSGSHRRGELFVDSRGDLFYCKTGGNPGTWFRVTLVPA